MDDLGTLSRGVALKFVALMGQPLPTSFERSTQIANGHLPSQEVGVVDRAPRKTHLFNVQRTDLSRPHHICPFLFPAHRIVPVQFAPRCPSTLQAGYALFNRRSSAKCLWLPRLLSKGSQELWGEFMNLLTPNWPISTYIPCSHHFQVPSTFFNPCALVSDTLCLSLGLMRTCIYL